MPETAVVTYNKAAILQLRERLEARRSEIEAALPPDILYNSFLRAIMTAAQINPEILACDFQSIWTSCMLACRDALLPDGKEAALVPYKKRCTYQPMAEGLVRSFQRSGQFKWITAGCVYKGEVFIRWIDETGEHFRHEPGDNFGTTIVRVYAAAQTRDGAFFCAVLPFAEAEKLRKFSKNTRDDSPWRQWPEAMYKKTALKRLLKLMPNVRSVIHSELLEAPTIDLPAIEQQPTTEEPEDARTGADVEGLGGATASAGPDPSSVGVQATDQEQHSTSLAEPEPVNEVARARGAQAKRDGYRATALPGEYRDPARAAEAAAWRAGWDEAQAPPPNTAAAAGHLLVFLAFCLLAGLAGPAFAHHKHHSPAVPQPQRIQAPPDTPYTPDPYRLADVPPWRPAPEAPSATSPQLATPRQSATISDAADWVGQGLLVGALTDTALGLALGWRWWRARRDAHWQRPAISLT